MSTGTTPSRTEAEPSFTAPPEIATFDGILFDLDGTIIDAKDAITKHWQNIGNDLGIDTNVILEASHGRRTIDTLKLLDPTKANWAYVSRMEALIPKQFAANAVTISGSHELLNAIDRAHIPWAIVTSATRALALGWLDLMQLPHPKCLIGADDVKGGKPDPEGYLSARQALGLADQTFRVLVVEDSPTGILAGQAAGCRVLGLATTYSAARVQATGTVWTVRDLESVKLIDKEEDDSAKFALRISGSLVPQ